MPWTADDEEINGLIDANMKSSPPNPPAVNTSETVKNLFKAYWSVIRGQVQSAIEYVDLTNSSTYIEASIAQVEAAATEANNAALDAETKRAATEVISNIVENDKIATENLKNEAQELINNAIIATNPQGEWNPSSNVPALTATPIEGVNGTHYDLVSDGLAPFSGSNFTSGVTSLSTGGKIVKKDETTWYYQPPSNLSLSKVFQLESKLDGIVEVASEVYIDNVKYEFCVINPSTNKASFGIRWDGKFIDFGNPPLEGVEISENHDDSKLFSIQDTNGRETIWLDNEGNLQGSGIKNETEKVNKSPLTDIVHIPLNGQSLSTGVDSTGAITTNSYFGNKKFSIGIRTWINENGEDPSTRSDNSFLMTDLNQDYDVETILNGIADSVKASIIGNNFQGKSTDLPWLLCTANGEGGRYLRELDKAHNDATDARSGARQSNGGYYATGIDDIARAKEVADSMGLSYSVPAYLWMQGEAEGTLAVNRWDAAFSSSDDFVVVNKQDYRQLISDMKSDIVAITGQREEPIFLSYKTSGSASGRTQMELMETGEITMVATLYMLPCAINSLRTNGEWGDYIHLTADAERWLGEQFGKVFRKLFLERKQWKPLHPISAILNSARTELKIKFHVPTLPLELDTTFLPKVQNYGFAVHKDNVQQTISSVELSSVDEIKITFPAALGAGDIRYSYATSNVQEAAVSVTLLSISDGATVGGKATKDFTFTGDISVEFEKISADGVFRISANTGASFAVIRDMRVESGNTILNAEVGEITGTPFSSGNTISLLKWRAWGNLRDSDNEISTYSFSASSKRQGKYPLQNWCLDFSKKHING